MDRVSLQWTGAQLDIIGQLASYGKPMVVLHMGAGQLDDSPLLKNENISAVLWAGYPGQDGGRALFDIIQGKVAPAGRLPTTQYPADYVAKIPMTDMSLRPNATSGSPGRTYIWYNEKPVLPFGHGLHYTNFTATVQAPSSNSYEISSLLEGCSETWKDRCLFENLAVDVENTGSVTSDYVTLGFLTGAHGPEPYPNKRLVAYERLFNVTGTSTATLKLTLGSLARRDDKGNRVLYPGSYALMVDVQPLACLNFTLTGDAVTLEQWPQPPEPEYHTTDYWLGGYGSGAPYQVQEPLYTDL
jgi:beta-D-xylosidase 4